MYGARPLPREYVQTNEFILEHANTANILACVHGRYVMLSVTEHKEFSKLLWRLRKRYPDRSYVQIIYDARSYCKPFESGAISDQTALHCLKRYATHD